MAIFNSYVKLPEGTSLVELDDGQFGTPRLHSWILGPGFRVLVNLAFNGDANLILAEKIGGLRVHTFAFNVQDVVETWGCVKTCGWFDTTNDKLSGWVRITIQTSVSCGWTAHFLGLLVFFWSQYSVKNHGLSKNPEMFSKQLNHRKLSCWLVYWLVYWLVIDGYWITPSPIKSTVVGDQKRAAFDVLIHRSAGGGQKTQWTRETGSRWGELRMWGIQRLWHLFWFSTIKILRI